MKIMTGREGGGGVLVKLVEVVHGIFSTDYGVGVIDVIKDTA